MNLLKRLLPFAALSLLCLAPAHADLIKQSASYNRTILVTSSSDHVTGATGLSSFVVKESKNGGAQATVTPTITELGLGRYSIALTNSDTPTLGALDLTITATGADPTDTHDQIVAFDPTDAAALGLSTLGTINTTTTGTNTLATGIKAKTDTIGTNSADSPNAVTAQGKLGTPATTISGDIGALPGIFWGYSTRTLTSGDGGGGGTTLTLAQTIAALAAETTQTVTIPTGTKGLTSPLAVNFNGATYTINLNTPTVVPQTIYEILHNGGYVP